MAKAASTVTTPPQPVALKEPEPKPEPSPLFEGALPISHPTLSAPTVPTHLEAPIVTCDGCKGWKRLHPKSTAGQCLPNSRYASGPIYTTDMASCAIADPL